MISEKFFEDKCWILDLQVQYGSISANSNSIRNMLSEMKMAKKNGNIAKHDATFSIFLAILNPKNISLSLFLKYNFNEY